MLFGASRLVIMEPSWNPALDKQVCGRVWRTGQTASSVHTYRIVSALTLEERMYAQQLRKTEVEAGIREYTKTTGELMDTKTLLSCI